MAAKEEKSRIFRTLLQIYWPLLLVGGVQLGWTLAQGGFAALAADMAVFCSGWPLFWAIILGGILLILTVWLMILLWKKEPPAPPEEEEDDLSDRFPGLDRRLKPQEESPQLVKEVFIPRTLPASSSEDGCLRLRYGAKRMEMPMEPGEKSFELDGYQVTVTITRPAEDITRDMPALSRPESEKNLSEP